MKTPGFRRFCPAVPFPLAWLGAGVVLCLTGCFDNDPGLQERLVRTQAEVQDKSRRIQELEAALEKAQTASARQPAPTPAETTASPTPAMLSKEQLEGTYVTAAKEMRQKVEAEVAGYTVENCTLFKVDMPSVALPYTSKVALNLRSRAGQPYRLEFPVGADWSGKWTFPATGDVIATLEKAQAQAAATPRTPPTGGNNNGPGTPPRGPTSVGGGNPTASTRPGGRAGEGPATTGVETIEMSWGGRRSSPGVAAPRRTAETPDATGPDTSSPAAPRVSSSTVPPPAAPPAGPNAQPRSAMPSERDVLIQF